MPWYTLTFIGKRGGRQMRDVFAEDSSAAMEDGRMKHKQLAAKAVRIEVGRKANETPRNWVERK